MDLIGWATVAGVLVTAATAFLALPGYARTREERSQFRFRAERRYLLDHRPELLLRAAQQYPREARIPNTTCLTSPNWVMPNPVPLDLVHIQFESVRRPAGMTGRSRAARRLLPLPVRRVPESTYTTALAADPQLRPRLFWDGISYDLRAFEVIDGSVRLSLGLANFFEMVDVCESFAHEFSSGRARRFRSMAKQAPDPFDLSKHVNIPALTWILLVRESDGSTTFLLHARDPDAVVSDGKFRHAYGGQVQPSSEHAIDPRDETTLWKSFAREFAEELLGCEETAGRPVAPLDFCSPPYSTLRRMTDDGRLTVSLLGLVIDPLSRWPSMLAAAVCDRKALEGLPSFVAKNSEGRVIGARQTTDGIEGYRLSEEIVSRLCSDPLVGMSAKGCLVRIWEHRSALGLIAGCPPSVDGSESQQNLGR